MLDIRTTVQVLWDRTRNYGMERGRREAGKGNVFPFGGLAR